MRKSYVEDEINQMDDEESDEYLKFWSISHMTEEEKVAYVNELTLTIHTINENTDLVLKEIVKSIERIIDHPSNTELIKAEAVKA